MYRMIRDLTFRKLMGMYTCILRYFFIVCIYVHLCTPLFCHPYLRNPNNTHTLKIFFSSFFHLFLFVGG